MTTPRTYLDWNATAPLCPAARAAMIEAMDHIGNPSSVHHEGRAARALIETARDAVAKLAGANAAEVVFTSGATEAAATVVAAGWDTIFVGATEHDCVLAPVRTSGAVVVQLPVDADGRIAAGELAAHLQRQPVGTRTLVAVQAANNETGVLQPVAEITAFARAHGAQMLVDAVQVPGRLTLAPMIADADFVLLSAHKLGGPKGIGALIVRAPAAVPSLITGGGQERRRRAGTENVLGIVGFGAAARTLLSHTEPAFVDRHRRFEAALIARDPQVMIVGSGADRLPNTTCLARRGARAETLVIQLDLAGIAVSAGAACSSGKVASSHVLAAMGLTEDLARSAIRMSSGPTTSDADFAFFLDTWTNLVRPAALAA